MINCHISATVLLIAAKFGLLTHFERIYPSEGHTIGAVFLTESPWSVKGADVGAPKNAKFGMRHHPAVLSVLQRLGIAYYF